MTREDQLLWFQASARLGRAEDEIAFLKDALAKETARTRKLGELIHTAADHLSKCKVTAGSQVRYLQPRIDKAALNMVAALTLVDAVIATEGKPIDLTDAAQLIEASQIGGAEQ